MKDKEYAFKFIIAYCKRSAQFGCNYIYEGKTIKFSKA